MKALQLFTIIILIMCAAFCVYKYLKNPKGTMSMDTYLKYCVGVLILALWTSAVMIISVILQN